MAVNDEILDQVIEHATYVERLKSQTAYKLIAVLNRTDDDLLEQIRKRAERIVEKGFDTGPETTKRLNDLLASLREVNASAYAAVGDELSANLQNIAKYEATWSTSLLSNAIPADIVVQLGVTRPDLRSLYKIVTARPFQGVLLKDALSEVEAGRARLVRDAIRQGLVEGQTTDEIVRRLKGTRKAKYADGLLDRPRRHLQALARTAIQHTVTAAREEMYKDNADIIKSLVWTSTLDGKTSAICRARDGKEYPVDSGPRPPAHWNCRSTMVSRLKSYKELGLDLDEVSPGTRASMDGSVAEDLTYGDFLRGKVKTNYAFVEDTLGVGKAKLFAQGKLPIDKFVNRAGDELTLDALRLRHPEEWARAGL